MVDGFLRVGACKVCAIWHIKVIKVHKVGLEKFDLESKIGWKLQKWSVNLYKNV
jgi:hypothetical protein